MVLIHTTALALGTLTKGAPVFYPLFLLNRVAQFAVPLFVFISGLALTYGYAARRIEYLAFLRKRVISVTVPYLLWSLIYFLRANLPNLGSPSLSLPLLVKGIVIGSTYYHLYFIIIILQFYLVFPFLLSLVTRFRSRRTLAVALIVAAHVGYLLFSQRFYFRYNDRFLPTYFLFFGLGMLAGLDIDGFRRFLTRRLRGVVAAFGMSLSAYLALSFADQVLGWTPPNLWFSLAWVGYSALAGVFFYLIPALSFNFHLSQLRRRRWTSFNGLLETLGRDSFAIYLMHPLILSVSGALLSPSKLASTTLSFALNVFLSIGLSVLATRFLRRAPYGRYLIGRVN